MDTEVDIWQIRLMLFFMLFFIFMWGIMINCASTEEIEVIETQAIAGNSGMTILEDFSSKEFPAIVVTEPVAVQPITSTTESIKKDCGNGAVTKITEEEREMLAALIYLEARGESYECQKAIVSVILNRVDSGHWGNSLRSVIYAKGQFTPACRISNTTPGATQYKAVDEVCQQGRTMPNYVLYFRAGYYHNWNGHRAYCQIEDTFFSYEVSDKR